MAPLLVLDLRCGAVLLNDYLLMELRMFVMEVGQMIDILILMSVTTVNN